MDEYPELQPLDGGVVLFLRAKPSAPRTEFVGRHGEELKIRIAAAPEQGKANEALVGFIARTFDLKRSQVTIRSGSTSRRKRVKLDGIDAETATQVLDRVLAD